MDDMNNHIDDSKLNQMNEPKITPTSLEKDKKGFAIAALVLGIVSLVLFCIWYISFPCAILGIIFGALSVKSSGRGMAIAGIVTSIIAILIDFFVVIFAAAFFSEIMSTMMLL